MAGARRDVQVRLIERYAFDQLRRCVAAKDLVHGPARLAVASAVGRHDHQLRALLQGLVQRHRRVHPKSPCFVRSAHDDSPARAARDGHRDASKLRVVSLVDRRVEGVEVDVEDRSRPGVGFRHVRCRGQSATRACGLLQVRALSYGLFSAAATLEKTLANWLAMVSRITTTTIETRTTTPKKTATVMPIAAPAPGPEEPAGGSRDGLPARPFQRHTRSSESAGFHADPSHHQTPSAEKRVWAAGVVGVPGSPPIS